MDTSKIDIVLYTAGTPNGQKVSIVLEELGLKYEVKHIDISKNTQKEDWFLRINPNGRIPAIVDRTPKLDGKAADKRIFEGGAILLYLTAKYDAQSRISYPFDTDKYWETVEWLVWMQSGIGPMQGQANHFYRYAPEKIEYGVKRYATETKRLYQVLEDRLKEVEGANRTCARTEASRAGNRLEAQPGRDGPGTEGPWLVGDKCTIADLACFSWVNWAEWAGIDLDSDEGAKTFPRLKNWMDRINARPAVKRGLDVPEKFEMKEKMKTKEGREEFAEFHSRWVMKGQESDQERHK